ncbi:hypothetical protein ACFLZR_01410, partial [Candidatus Neomarinimicrobiota bacterium]
AVVEGVGDHGCEYMTGGTVVVLGETGRNFAAGMSGGIAYIFDPDERFPDRCNRGMVELTDLDGEDVANLSNLLLNHRKHTGSKLAADILDNFGHNVCHFVKVLSAEYKRILEARKVEDDLTLLEVSDG